VTVKDGEALSLVACGNGGGAPLEAVDDGAKELVEAEAGEVAARHVHLEVKDRGSVYISSCARARSRIGWRRLGVGQGAAESVGNILGARHVLDGTIIFS
jgi:hypothetical protein